MVWNEKIYTKVLGILFGMLAMGGVFLPQVSHAATATVTAKTVTPTLEISGWLPYWRVSSSTTDALAHIDAFTQISPFGFTVKNDGSLYDAMGIATTSWQTLITIAQAKKIKVIPSIMWSDANAIDAVLRNPKLRKAHIQNIIDMLNTYHFDGVDIDYEGKKDSTMNYFSLFLRDLYAATGKRLVVCTIEPRTPLDSRYDTVPKNIQYANDFTAINKYCDQVRIMTYDQGTIDLKLNRAASGPYNPIADTQWVEKVIRLAEQTIAKKKIVIGVATYGHEYTLTPTDTGYQYNFLTSFNPGYALSIASTFGSTPTRNRAGELSFTYLSTTTPTELHYLSWSDAVAIQAKVALAKKLGVRGIAIFKIDGGEDSAMWNVLK